MFFALSLFGQNAENNTIVNKSNELGMHAGFTTGLGLSYRHWTDDLGVQITAIPIKSEYSQFISIGFTGLYSVSESDNHRFFLYLGNHFLVYNDHNTEYKYHIGLGPGFETGRNVKFNIMVGYGAYNLLESNYKLLPAIETGLYFKL